MLIKRGVKDRRIQWAGIQICCPRVSCKQLIYRMEFADDRALLLGNSNYISTRCGEQKKKLFQKRRNIYRNWRIHGKNVRWIPKRKQFSRKGILHVEDPSRLWLVSVCCLSSFFLKQKWFGRKLKDWIRFLHWRHFMGKK